MHSIRYFPIRCCKVKDAVHRAVADVVTWSMRWALKGKYPHKGMFGETFEGERLKSASQEIAQGFRFAYFGFKADAKARKECHAYDRSYQHTQICETCLAEKPSVNGNPDMNFKNFFRTAPYLLTGLSHSDYVATASRVTPWNNMPGFNIKTCFRDPMHTIFLGTAKEVLASSMGYWARSQLLEGNSLSEQLRWFSRMQHACCFENGLKGSFKTYTPANTGLVSNTEFPELGSSFKAASIKVSIWFFAKFAGELSAKNLEEPSGYQNMYMQCLNLWVLSPYHFWYAAVPHVSPGLWPAAYRSLPLESAKGVGAYGSQWANFSQSGSWGVLDFKQLHCKKLLGLKNPIYICLPHQLCFMIHMQTLVYKQFQFLFT